MRRTLNSFRSVLCLGLLAGGMVAVAQQQPPTTPPAEGAQEPTARPGIQVPPPPPPKLPDVRQPGETGWWITLEGSFPTQKPDQLKGKAAAFSESGNIRLEGKPKFAQSVEIGMAV